MQITSYIIPKNFVLANCALNTRDTFKGRCSLFLAFKFKDHAVRSDPNNVANDFLHHSYKLCFSKLCSETITGLAAIGVPPWVEVKAEFPVT